MVYSCAGSSDLFVMTSNFSCGRAFSTLHSSTLWKIDTIIFTTLKKSSSLSSPPPPPPPTNVLEINKPPGGGGGASSMTARSNIDRTISQGSSDQNSRLGEPNRSDAEVLQCRDSHGFEARCS